MSIDPLRHFETEHEEALAALARLEGAAEGLRASEPAQPHLGVAREVHAVLAGAVREHNEAEERALFPFLGADAPLQPFLEEHQTLWTLEERLGEALARGDAVLVADLGLEIVQLLRAHIQRENDMLFPLARAHLGPEGLAAVAEVLEKRSPG